MIAAVFPGQGSQRPQMGRFFLEQKSKTIQCLFEEASEIFSVDFSFLLDQGSPEELQRWAQPSLFLMGALWRVFLENHGLPMSSWVSYGAGHSLGEYTALHCGGVLSFSQGLNLIKERLNTLSQAPQGSMGALLGLPKPLVESLIKIWDIPQCFVSNHNSVEQVVVSGITDSMNLLFHLMVPLVKSWPLENPEVFQREDFLCLSHDLQDKIKSPSYKEGVDMCQGYKKIKYVPLKVGGPFHCALMEPVQEIFNAILSPETFLQSDFPILSNTNPQNPQKNGEELKKALKSHMASPVRWAETMDFFVQNDIKGLVEIGPGQVLSNLAKGSSFKGWSLCLQDEKSFQDFKNHIL